VTETKALTSSANLLGGKQLVLEAFEFPAEVSDPLKAIALWLATHALPGEANRYFADKLKTDLILLSDTDFAHFARYAMVVEPHVRINDDTGTAEKGGLFYVENLPPETLMVGLAQASIERFKKGSRHGDSPELLSAPEVLRQVFAGQGDSQPGIGSKLLQIGGDATTGRGLVLVHNVPTA
jgi:CRISPR-associated protein Cmr4